MLPFARAPKPSSLLYRRLFIAIFLASTPILAADSQDGPKDAVVLIIRHAEDGGTGHDLAPRGHERAEAYKNYFLTPSGWNPTSSWLLKTQSKATGPV